MSDLDVTKPDTWPMVLSLEDVARIYGTTPLAIQDALKPSRHRVCPVPKPFMRHPSRWRKADIVRHVEGARVTAFSQKAS